MLIRSIKAVLDKLGLLAVLRHTQLYRDLAFKTNSNLRTQILAEINFYSIFLKSDELCFDIGASLGGKTNIFYKIGGRVVAVEPDPEAFDILTKRFGKNNKVVLLNKGVGAVPGELLLNRSDNSTLSTFDQNDVEATLNDVRFSTTKFYDKKAVKIETLDNLILQFGQPDYCKISTVGYEIEVLKGLSKPLKTISITCNVPQHIEKTIECVNLIDKLGSYRYNYFLSTLLNDFAEPNWITGTEMKNRLVIMKNTPDHSRYIEVFAVQNHI